MNISIFGLGYVGCVAAGCFSENGHSVVGVDVNPRKVQMVNEGTPPVDEPGLEHRFEKVVNSGHLRATTDVNEAITETDVSFLAVGTPLDSTGQLSTTNLYNVLDSIVDPLSEKREHTLIVRSTVPPNTTRKLRSYLVEKLPDDNIVDFVVNPEFLREGTAIDDFYDPPYVVLGPVDGADVSHLESLYESMDVQGDIYIVEPEIAESIKFVSNTFHALKITFANEVSSIMSEQSIDGKKLMDLVCRDEKLNISPSYLEPGMSFGGSCLPKDNQAMATLADDAAVDIPLLSNIQDSNVTHHDRIANRINDLDVDTVGIIGVSFKSGTADMRNSQSLELAQKLDKEVYLYGDGVDASKLVGSNRDYVDRVAPDIESQLFTDPQSFLDTVDAVVFTNRGSYSSILANLDDHIICDPVGTVQDDADEFAEYYPIVW